MRLFTYLTLSGAILTGTAYAGDTTDIDTILSQLNRQQDNASALVKATKEPLSISKTLPQVTQSKAEDVLSQLTAVASNTVSKFKQTGLASWYGRQFHGKKTASGERFDMNALTAAHPSLPMNCYIKVTNKSNGKSVVVRVNDRGPFHGSRVLDLSYGAAKAIGITQSGTGNVAIERVDGP